MKMKRKGYGIGKGQGYKNLMLMDSYIHSLSAKGVKSAYNLKIYDMEGDVVTNRFFQTKNKAMQGLKKIEKEIGEKIPKDDYELEEIELEAKGVKTRAKPEKVRVALMKKAIRMADTEGSWDTSMTYGNISDLWTIDYAREKAKEVGLTLQDIKAQLKIAERKYKATQKKPELLARDNTGLYYMGDGTYNVYVMASDVIYPASELEKYRNKLIGKAKTRADAERISADYQNKLIGKKFGEKGSYGWDIVDLYK